MTVTTATPDRAVLGPAARLNLDTLAAVGGLGWLRKGDTRGVYTLDVTADPAEPTSPVAPAGRVALHNIAYRTMDELHAAGLIEYPEGKGDVRLTDAGEALARPDRRRAELAGIAAVAN